MNLHTTASAVSPSPRTGSAATSLDGGRARLANLPLWARAHAALIAEIVAEQPERTKVLTEFSANSPASFGYRGKKAALLRYEFALVFSDMMRAMPEHGTAAYEAARDGLIRFEREQGADAVIARAMAA